MIFIIVQMYNTRRPIAIMNSPTGSIKNEFLSLPFKKEFTVYGAEIFRFLLQE